MKRLFPLLLITLILSILSCSKDDDDNNNEETKKIEHLNEFVYENMNFAYLWNDQIPDLDFKKYKDPKKLFEDILYSKYDKWSIITDNMNELLKRFNGINLSFGAVLAGGRYSNTDGMFVIVMYVYKDSPAYKAGLKRGDIITKVDNQALVSSNIDQLLSQNTCRLTLAEYKDEKISETGTVVTITKEEINEYPIICDKIFDNETGKTAYLMYDSFIDRFNDDLKGAFGRFKEEGVNNLILDLRYNLGGDEGAARLLGSIIAPYEKTKDRYFFKSMYNPQMTKLYNNHSNEEIREHAKGIKFIPTDEGLNLDKVYILSSRMTASSSELIINGLKPFMDVVLIGDNTHGKCTGMVQVSNDEYPDWGMFPVVVKASNDIGVTDYFEGLTPDYKITEKLPYKPIGSIEDPLIRQAMDIIAGHTKTAIKPGSEKEFTPAGLFGAKPDEFRNIIVKLP